jgi:aminoglycoside phosphotransferase (APT) family kinase protein
VTAPSSATVEALESYLAAELDAPVVGTEVLGDGLNLILGVSTADGSTYVLRRPNKLRHTSYLNDLRTEYQVMRRLDETAIPTPAPVMYCDDESLLCGPFFLVEHLDGAVVPLGSDLPARFRTPVARRQVAEQLVDTLAEVHSLDIAPFEEVCGRRPPREQVTDAVDRFDALRNATGRAWPRLRAVGQWLLGAAPSDPQTTLVHGDFRPGNVLFAGHERPEITGVLDWESATLGDPLTELGYLLLRWRDAGDPTPSLDELEARYSNANALADLRARNENGLAPFTAAPGSPSRRELVARYEGRTGRTFEDERFYRTLAAFLLASVWGDLHRHSLEAGVESDWEPYIEYMAMVAESLADGGVPL